MGRTVAIYARVSTEHEAQLSALENQVQYYENLLALHPDWKLYKQYIDEGITGTSVNKRKSFLAMMQDAEDGMFDLIVTREVSRFARNTVDTLQKTRKLKKMGVEVFFTEDNIWTMNDEDGELRLTIMATLAQNESKKTSMRVKAGQRVSFQNGVLYGTGNILGYDRVGKELVINKEQAETVRMIYDLYLQGLGTRKIKDQLELNGRLTAMGKKRWDTATIGHILKNPFYSGTIVYRKEYVPDFLEQKKIANRGNVEKIVVEGKHEPIVTKEEFELVQKRLQSHSCKAKNYNVGKREPDSIWCKKLKCMCGHSFNRRVWTRTKKNGVNYAFQCYNQRKTGTIEYRAKRGLDVEGICDAPMIPEWKMDLMLRFMIEFFWRDKSRVLKIANELLENNLHAGENSEIVTKIKKYSEKLNTLNRKLDNLAEMRLGEEISREFFLRRKKELEEEIESVKTKLDELNGQEKLSEDDVRNKLEVLKYSLEQNFDITSKEIPETLIDALVQEIVVYKDKFAWKLNLFDESIYCRVEGNNKEGSILVGDDVPTEAGRYTGRYRRSREISQKRYRLMTIKVLEEDAKDYWSLQPEHHILKRFEPFVFEIYI